MEQPRREMEQRSAGGHDVTQFLTAGNSEYDITFDCEIWREISE